MRAADVVSLKSIRDAARRARVECAQDIAKLSSGNEKFARHLRENQRSCSTTIHRPPNIEAAKFHRDMRAFAEQHGAVLYDCRRRICPR